MLVKTIRKPGQRGTLDLVEKYGDRLVCVRYRYDPKRKQRFKTAEIIVEQREWEPEEAPSTAPETPTPIEPPRYTRHVGLRIRYNEKDLQRKIKAIGGTWSPAERLWYAPEEYVRKIGLEGRIVKR